LAEIIKRVYISKEYSPFENLALEEYLLNSCQANEIILYLWQNDSTIVIGKHQNAYQECNLPLMEEDNILLARRKSGGGAVYHDLGNLNYTFIASKSNYQENKNFKVILAALKDFNIEGNLSGRNDICVADKKVSGCAFIHEDNIECHHGSILVNSDLKKLAKYLSPSPIKIKSKGINSVKSRVANLKEFNSRITVDSLINKIIDHFNLEFDGLLDETKVINNPAIKKLEEEYQSWQWNFGQSPQSSLSKSQRFSWGTIDLSLTIINGQIKNCDINTDSLLNENFSQLSKNVVNKEARLKNIREQIGKYIVNNEVKFDLLTLFKSLVLEANHK